MKPWRFHIWSEPGRGTFLDDGDEHLMWLSNPPAKPWHAILAALNTEQGSAAFDAALPKERPS